MLPRFVELFRAAPRFDGVPLADWDLASLRRQFALVSQDVVMLNDSVLPTWRWAPSPSTASASRPARRAANLAADVMRCRRASTPSSATTRSNSPAASASVWPSPAPSTATRHPILDEATSALDENASEGWCD